MNDLIIWRYVDFTKFADFIDRKSLFFCRSDNLGDPFEGSYPRHVLEQAHAHLREKGLPDAELEKILNRNTAHGQQFRKYVFINCWHISEHESVAMWKVYLRNAEGIAIKSRHSNLMAATIRHPDGIWSAPVKYIDFANDSPPVPTRIAPFRYKRKSFEYENELRLLVIKPNKSQTEAHIPPPDEPGIYVEADPNVVIDEIFQP